MKLLCSMKTALAVMVILATLSMVAPAAYADGHYWHHRGRGYWHHHYWRGYYPHYGYYYSPYSYGYYYSPNYYYAPYSW